MAWSSKPTFQAGVYPDGADLEAIVDQVDSLTSADRTDYSGSMSITGASSDPSLGNSTLQALYRQASGSNLVHFSFKLTIGSTFSAGSGVYTFSLPVAMASPQIDTGACNVFDTGAFVRTLALVPSSSTGLVAYIDGSGSAIGSGGPAGAGWATGDWISATILYSV